ncbi:hypothetical protein JQC67_11540 [Aurantibacter crassamenti]|uniref:Ig-like domain-containing protein n=1 Tax=Aurantibacter crassamenti TaxID=1837375 RepID=UPI001939511A|nr:Ig-like domain-containing protein [Aurantibacter crassamenti]MBM1106774.1 hypothetical protein [Aurantibacter crassamenti]
MTYLCVKNYQYMLFFALIISFISCSKDSDLLSEYVIADHTESRLVSNIFIADNFIINGNDAIVLDVLLNDSISNYNDIKIINTTQPENGTVLINEDKTLTYIPDASVNEEETTDNFTYTTQENESGSTVNTKVDVTKINDEVKYWKRLFDIKWADSDYDNASSRSKSANKEQEYYFLAYFIDGLSTMWQATGDNVYLDQALGLINNTIKDAKSVGNGYKGWPAKNGTEYTLWDSYYWRTVATLVRIMHQSPNLRSTGYQEEFENLLAFSENNIWDRYFSYGLGSIYRSRTHMASHWARIGMELYIVTGEKKYKEVFDNISFGEMPGRESNLQNQFYPNPKNPKAYAWDSHWGSIDGSEIQDTSHAGTLISLWVLAYDQNMYWTKSDINGLIPILDIVWSKTNSKNIKLNIDGSGGYGAKGRLHEWFYLGRFDQKLQDRIKKEYIGSHLNYFGTQVLGIAALNAKILSDGSPVYPEK